MGVFQTVRTPAAPEVSSRLQWTAIILRAAFIGLLMVLILRVSQPQSETIWSAYETTGDLVRLVLGLGACLWMGIQAFSFPKDADAYRIWLPRSSWSTRSDVARRDYVVALPRERSQPELGETQDEHLSAIPMPLPSVGSGATADAGLLVVLHPHLQLFGVATLQKLAEFGPEIGAGSPRTASFLG